jgi:hypothetical protein
MRLPQISNEQKAALDALRNMAPKSGGHQALAKDFASKSAPAPE